MSCFMKLLKIAFLYHSVERHTVQYDARFVTLYLPVLARGVRTELCSGRVTASLSSSSEPPQSSPTFET